MKFNSLWLVALIEIFHTLWDIRKYKNILKNGIQLKGKIIRYERYPRSIRIPVIQFQYNGHMLERESLIGYSGQPHGIGSELDIIYWHDYFNKVVVIDPNFLYKYWCAMLIIVVPCILYNPMTNHWIWQFKC